MEHTSDFADIQHPALSSLFFSHCHIELAPSFQRTQAAKSIMKRHTDTLCTRGDRLVFQGQMALRAMDAAPVPGSPKVPKTGNFCRESS